MAPTVESGAARRAAQFRALADGTRLRILAFLRDGEHCVCELTEALEVGQSLLSFHLKTLKEAGLVSDRREGRWTYCSLEQSALDNLAAYLTSRTLRPIGHARSARRCR